MTAFLASIASQVITAVLSLIGGWFLKVLHIWLQDRADNSSNEAKVAAAQKALEDAKSKQELDDAAKKISQNFGSK